MRKNRKIQRTKRIISSKNSKKKQDINIMESSKKQQTNDRTIRKL